MSNAYKLYADILNRRLRAIAENLIGEEQMGFRRGRSCMDAVFTLKQIIEKNREYNCETHMAFIDWQKAFDNVLRARLWDVMLKKGYPKHLVAAIAGAYTNTDIIVMFGNNEKTEKIKINKGVRQGCPMSPTLFNIYTDEILNIWNQNVDSGIQLCNNVFLNSLLYADDTVIIFNSEDKLQYALFKLNKIGLDFGMKISPHKSKVMAFRGKWPIRCKIVLDDQALDQARDFSYLGCRISFVEEDDVNEKLAKFSAVCGSIRRAIGRKTRQDTQLKFYRTMAIPLIAYGSEAWVPNRRTESRIQAAEMRFLRAIKGYSRLDHIRNENIRADLRVEPLLETLKRNRRNWSSHLLRMPRDRLPILAWEYQPDGKRGVGRPRKKWMPEQANRA